MPQRHPSQPSLTPPPPKKIFTAAWILKGFGGFSAYPNLKKAETGVIGFLKAKSIGFGWGRFSPQLYAFLPSQFLPQT